MRNLPLWKNYNEKSYLIWFEKYEGFLSGLVRELGFVSIHTTEIESLGEGRYLHMTFTHEDGNSFSISLIRNTIFLGGGISFKDIDEPIYTTVKFYPKYDVFGESRVEIGNWFIGVLRDNWLV